MTHSPPPNAATEAAAAGNYPSSRFNQRERRLIECVVDYTDAEIAELQAQIDALGPLLPAPGYATTLLGATAAAYEAFGDTGVTNSVGTTTILGNVGIRTGSISGFPPGIITGTQHSGDAEALAVYASYAAAKSTVSGLGYSVDRTATPGLENQLLFPGVYKFDTAASIAVNTTLTLDGAGNQNAQFVFNIGTTLTTGATVTILLQNGARADNVIWNVGTGATLGATNAFKGQLWAGTTVILGSGTSVVGRLFADTAITLDTNVLNHAS